jgi:large subunit ribosomal protein L35
MAKRIKLSATGKLMHRRAFRNHMLAKKQASTKREYVKEFEVAAGDKANIKKMLGTYNAR